MRSIDFFPGRSDEEPHKAQNLSTQHDGKSSLVARQGITAVRTDGPEIDNHPDGPLPRSATRSGAMTALTTRKR